MTVPSSLLLSASTSSNRVQSTVVPSGTATAAGSARLEKSRRPLAPTTASVLPGEEDVVWSSERPVVGLRMGWKVRGVRALGVVVREVELGVVVR